MVLSQAGLRWRGTKATVNYRPNLSSVRALQNNKPENWSRVPDGCLTPGRTGRLTVGRNLTSTSIWVVLTDALDIAYVHEFVC
jgi:hypothetical protein